MKLVDLAKTIRSKNAGTDRITFDIIFPDPEAYHRARRSGRLTRETVAALFGIPTELRILQRTQGRPRRLCGTSASVVAPGSGRRRFPAAQHHPRCRQRRRVQRMTRCSVSFSLCRGRPAAAA